MANSDKERDELLGHLTDRAAKFRAHARKNDAAAAFCYLGAIVGSLAATICTAFAGLDRWALTLITAIPGTVLLVNSVFAFDKKCRWHRKRKKKYDAFAMRIRYEDTDAAAISRELREFEDKIDEDYPRLGSPNGVEKDKNA
jgi:hypothetical protein